MVRAGRSRSEAPRKTSSGMPSDVTSAASLGGASKRPREDKTSRPLKEALCDREDRGRHKSGGDVVVHDAGGMVHLVEKTDGAWFFDVEESE